jgi:hypothetical protein
MSADEVAETEGKGMAGLEDQARISFQAAR